MVFRNALSGNVSMWIVRVHGLCPAILELAFGIRGGLLQLWISGVGSGGFDSGVGG